MKITEEKHNHKLTNLLKVFIFSILMLLPFLNVAVRCAYVTFNKNAYQSYYGDTINESEIIYTNEIIAPNKYYLYKENNVVIPQTNFIGVENLTLNTSRTDMQTWVNDNINNIAYFRFISAELDTGYRMNFYDSNFIFLNNFGYLQYNLELEFTATNSVELTFNNWFYTIKYNDYSYLDNVFEYSINKLEEEQYINWTQNTAVYQGVESMTTGLGITQTVIPMLIVYWFMLTIIYVIIDIVLAIFTKLTHMIGNKTA